jgi:drug/metabolite transporter (DMT)-like permease
VVPIASFLLALPRVGPGTASILSTFETVVGVGLAAVLLGESLDPLQATGAALVVGAVIMLQLGAPTRVRSDDAPARTPAGASARALAEQPA